MGYLASGVRMASRLALAGALVCSLALNVAMVVGGAIYEGVSSAVEATTGMRTVASRHASEVADLTDDLNAERRVNRELRGEVAELSDNLVNERRVTSELQEELADVSDNLVNERATTRQLKGEVADLSDDLVSERAISRQLRGELTDASGELVSERAVTRQLRSEVSDYSERLAAEQTLSRTLRSSLDDATDGLVTFRGRKVAVAEAVEETADLISTRASKSASREIGSMAGEALPWIGTAVIVGVTTMEINDLCNTIRDMNELKRAFNPSLAPSEDQLTVCSMVVPSRQELWEAAKSSPGQAWEKAKELTPTLEDIQGIDLTQIDWKKYGDAIEDAGKGMMDAARESARDLMNWFNGSDAEEAPEH